MYRYVCVYDNIIGKVFGADKVPNVVAVRGDGRTDDSERVQWRGGAVTGRGREKRDK